MNIKSHSKRIIADLYTPVGIFLKLRDNYSQVVMLESSDYTSKENAMSYICFESLAHIQLDSKLQINDKENNLSLVEAMQQFLSSIEIDADNETRAHLGIFGFNCYNAVEHYESIKLDKTKELRPIPKLRYDFYRFVLAFDHFHNEIFLIENLPDGESPQLDRIERLLKRQDHAAFSFDLSGEESSTTSNEEFLEMVRLAKKHCKRGDIFQIVLSRKFEQAFQGDEFQVYRALRSINPSPYLFYFDYGAYKIFGSSPEAQLKIEDGIAEIHPIAGTFIRSGDKEKDAKMAEKLLADPKENSEHVMLVDLARNDLSKNAENVHVASFRDIQYYSHVIHLVSKVIGKISSKTVKYRLYADTFPAGTLSGAPKYKAMQLIDHYEKHGRSFYGGGIGLIKMNGDINHAIIIRSFLSIDNVLHYQAGAGLVIESDEKTELQEVNNKLAALKKAIQLAETI